MLTHLINRRPLAKTRMMQIRTKQEFYLALRSQLRREPCENLPMCSTCSHYDIGTGSPGHLCWNWSDPVKGEPLDAAVARGLDGPCGPDGSEWREARGPVTAADPSSDAWVSTSTAAGTPDARTGHLAVWTGGQMIVWGGLGGESVLNSGGSVRGNGQLGQFRDGYSRRTGALR